MEKSLSLISLTWRDSRQILIALGRRLLLTSLAIALRTIETVARLSSRIAWKTSGPKAYPSHRPCPTCGEKTFYQASPGVFFTGLYTRTCSACGYRDSKKVKMIRQL